MKTSAKNASWILAGKGLSVAAQALYFVVLARLLGSQGYGIYVAVAAMVAVVNQYGSLGSGYVFLRYVSRDPSKAPEFFGNIIYSTLIFSPLLIVGLCVIGPKILHNDSWLLILLIAVSDCLLAALILAASQVFQALERMQMTALVSVVADVLRLVAGLLLLFTFKTVTVMQAAIITVIVSAVSAVVALMLVYRAIGKPVFAGASLKKHGREGLTFALSSSTSIVSNDIDKVMLGHYNMNAANGIYSLAYRGVSACSMPMVAVYAAFIPRFFKEGEHGVQRVYDLAKRLFWKMTPLSFVMGALMFFMAPLVPFFAGPSFQESVYALRWLCLIPFCRNLQWSAGDALTGSGHHETRLVSQGIAAVFNLSINMYLIPKYSWWGAAWASLATDGLLGLGMWGVLWNLRNQAPVLIAPEA
jgi:O-antigen/teichoic acid export membrane protein